MITKCPSEMLCGLYVLMNRSRTVLLLWLFQEQPALAIKASISRRKSLSRLCGVGNNIHFSPQWPSSSAKERH